MSGLTTYPQSERQTSELIGYGIRQAGVQKFLTDSNVTSATSVQDLIDDVNAAVVAPGLDDQRLEIVRCLQEGKALGDLSDARVQAATSLADLVAKTWCTTDDPDTSHLGVNLIG